MKRYLLFAGDNYYPVGGWDDFKGSFTTLKAAVEAAKSKPTDWYHVIDSQTGTKFE